MDVVPVGLDSSDGLLDVWVRLYRCYDAETMPQVDPVSDSEALAELNTDDELRRRAVLAFDGREPIGALVWTKPQLESPLLAWGEMYVVPPARRRGTARRMLAEAVRDLRADGRECLLLEAPVTGPGADFCRGIGAETSMTDVCSLLELGEVDWADVEALAERQVEGFRLVQWCGPCPDEMLDRFAAACAVMNDAPRAEPLMEDAHWDAARVRAMEQRRTRWGKRVYTTVAVHAATGDVAGYTEIHEVGRPHTALQDDTGVLGPHRGHGIGLWLKAANLRWLRAAEPQIERLTTWNAEDNRWMRAVNERLGYRPIARWSEFALPV